MKRAFKVLAWGLLLFFLYFFGVLLHGGITDYQPEAIIPLKTDQESPLKTLEDSTLNFTIWNIGYCGLGAEADFFYHGSGFWMAGDDMVFPPENLTQKYLKGVQDYLSAKPFDFYLLQEVDFESKRSYYTNQFEAVKKQLPSFSASKATNFDVQRVPAPALQPWNAYGKCFSGLATYSKYQPTEVTRYQLPGEFSWPNKPFMLDRCLQVSRFPFGGKELVVVNVHNTAYERDGAQKMQQLEFLKNLIVPEYEKGNYVIAGGDWNQCPPGITRDHFKKINLKGTANTTIPADQFPSGWQWAYDGSTPTNRSNRDPYKAEETFTALIDFYLLSPNIEILKVKGIDMQFAYSDHQPVELEVRLK